MYVIWIESSIATSVPQSCVAYRSDLYSFECFLVMYIAADQRSESVMWRGIPPSSAYRCHRVHGLHDVAPLLGQFDSF